MTHILVSLQIKMHIPVTSIILLLLIFSVYVDGSGRYKR